MGHPERRFSPASGAPDRRAASPAVLDEMARDAIAASHLRELPPDVVARLTAGGHRLRARAGATLHSEGDTAPHLELVVSGLIRVFVTAPDGRTMTVRYCRAGAILGAVSLFAASFSLPATIQALVESDLLVFRPPRVLALVDADSRVARAMLRELSERVTSFIAEIPRGAFATARERIARHLLDLASEHQRGSELVATVTHQELADAGGTVREVVVRILRDYREAGVVRTGRHGIVILAPDRLVSDTHARGETQVTDTPGNARDHEGAEPAS